MNIPSIKDSLRKAGGGIAVILSIARSQGQEPFLYHAVLGQAGKDGFYKITLAPRLLATCKEDRSDIRIAGGDGKYVPYVLKSDLPLFSSQTFQPFPVLFNAKREDSTTELVVGNKADTLIGSLLLQVSNYSADRKATLSGSDDRNHWYVIRESIALEEANSNTREYHVQSISFPPSRYRFFRMKIEDRGKLPIKILGAGIYTSNSVNGKYLSIPDPAIVQRDSADKHSYIGLHYDASYFIDQVVLHIRGPVFYKRKAWVYAGNMADGRRVAEIELSPSNGTFRIPSVKTSQLLIDIDNGDNPPLTIREAESYQLNQYLLAYLQAGNSYTLLTGNSSALSPDYDLTAADDSLMANPQVMTAGLPERIVLLEKPPTEQKKTSGGWLWLVLAVVLLLLGLLSFRMIQSITERQKTDRDR